MSFLLVGQRFLDPAKALHVIREKKPMKTHRLDFFIVYALPISFASRLAKPVAILKRLLVSSSI